MLDMEVKGEIDRLNQLVESLVVKVAKLEHNDRRVWMKINKAADSDLLRGRISAKQIKDRIEHSIDNPATAMLQANVHYQVSPHLGSGYRSFIVNIIEIDRWLKQTTIDAYYR